MKPIVKSLSPAFILGLVLLFGFLSLVTAPAAHGVTTETIPISTVISEEGENGSAWISSADGDATFTFKASEWDGSYDYDYAEIISDSNTTGGSWCNLDSYWDDDEEDDSDTAYDSVDSNTAGDVYENAGILIGTRIVKLTVYGKGAHKIVIGHTFCNEKGKALYRFNYTLTIKLKCVGITKTSLVSYKGKKTTLKTEHLEGSIKWKSTNKKIASVSSKGVVTGKKPGRCYIQATGISGHTGKTVTVKCLAEVTYKKAYSAVQNAWKDYRNSKLKYSQAKRMKKNYRDCSSFVGRCYWDSSLKRKLLPIGGSSAKSWSYNAAAQAKWLNQNKKTVAKKAVSLSKLLPGDTIYYETGYAGQNNQYRHIDHAAIYVGGGVVLNTSSNGSYGCIGNRGYYKYDPSIKFIGRPCK